MTRQLGHLFKLALCLLHVTQHHTQNLTADPLHTSKFERKFVHDFDLNVPNTDKTSWMDTGGVRAKVRGWRE